MRPYGEREISLSNLRPPEQITVALTIEVQGLLGAGHLVISVNEHVNSGLTSKVWPLCSWSD